MPTPTADQLAAAAANDQALKLPPGTTARQIGIESNWNPNAVSNRGALGYVQVMPGTLNTISQRVGRPLDPSNLGDALTIQKAVMQENLQHFGNVPDALRAYNSGWDKSKWNNPETNNYVSSITGGGGGGGSSSSGGAGGGVGQTMRNYASNILGMATGSTSAQAGELTPQQRAFNTSAQGPAPPPAAKPMIAAQTKAQANPNQSGLDPDIFGKDTDQAPGSPPPPPKSQSGQPATPTQPAPPAAPPQTPAQAAAVKAGLDPDIFGVDTSQTETGWTPPSQQQQPAPAPAPAAAPGAAPAATPAAPAAPQDNSFLGQLKHQGGLFLRDAAQAVGSVPALVVDPVTGLSNTFLGTHFQTGAAAIDNALDSLGVPREANARERIINNVAKAVGTVATQAGAANAIAGAASYVPGLGKAAAPVAQNVAAQFGENLGMQAASAAGGAGASSMAQESGFSPGVQMGAGLLGSMIAPVGMATAKAVGGAGSGLLSTMGRSSALKTAEGQTAAAQDILAGQVASGAPAAREIFDNSNVAGTPAANTPAGGGGVFPVGESPIPGVTRTLPERTMNPDVAQVYRTIPDRTAIATAESRNTAARTDFLRSMVGDEDTVTNLTRDRTDATTPIYNQAANTVLPVDDHLNAIFETPSGQNALHTAQRNWRDNAATRNLPFFTGTEDAPTMTGNALQQFKFALDGIVDNSMSSDNPSTRRAAGSLAQELSQWMTDNHPAYAQANATFADMSQPINEMRYLQSQRLANVQGDVTLQQVDGLLNRITQNAARDPFGAGAVSDETIQNLTNLRDDLRISQAAKELGKQGGSDTAQKLSQDYAAQTQTPIGRVVSKAAGVAGKAVGATTGGLIGGTPGAVVGGALGEAWDASRRAAADTAQQGLLARLAEQVVHPNAVNNVGARVATRAAQSVPQLPAPLGGIGYQPAALPTVQAGLIGLLTGQRARQ